MVKPIYLINIPIKPTIAKYDKEKIWKYCMEFGFVHSSKNLKAQLNYLSPPIEGYCRYALVWNIMFYAFCEGVTHIFEKPTKWNTRIIVFH
jgi:hypothetical protein